MKTPDTHEPRYCECGCGKEIERSKSMGMKRFLTLRFIHGHNMTKPPGKPRECACGCGELMVFRRGQNHQTFKKQRYIQGHHRGHDECEAKRSAGIKAAHERGVFKACYKRRIEKTLKDRPRCKCGCGKPVRASKALYARGCFDATTPENQAKAIAARDMDKLKAENSVRMADNMKAWKESGRLDDIRRKAGNAAGMLDHLAAKVWIIRDPYGHIHRFSNLSEWARQNVNRFVDDWPESKTPFPKRISGGISKLLSKDGRSCSYRGWVAVSKMELESGGADLLGRDYFAQTSSDHE